MRHEVKSVLLFGILLAVLAPFESQSLLRKTQWVSSWGTALQIPEANNTLPDDDLRDATLRQILHLTLGGSTLCLHVSNVFGTMPLHLSAVHIARSVSSSGSAIVPETDLAVTFAGRRDVTIPAGAEYLSDPIHFAVKSSSDVAISIYYVDPPIQQTGHPGSRATSYYVHGDKVSEAELPASKTVEHWYQLSELDVQTAPTAATLVALGDSITDGHGATTNANNRWTDVLAGRLLADSRTNHTGVVNAGIGGGRILLDGLGPNLLARFDRDVLARSGVRYVIVLEGVNDLGTLTRNAEKTDAEHRAEVQSLIAAYAQIVERAHAHGIKVFGATITPYGGSDYYHPGPLSERDRQELNDWIRAEGHFDAVVDFDRVIRDPASVDRMLPEFDSGDHLHPSVLGYKAMGNAIPLGLFAER